MSTHINHSVAAWGEQCVRPDADARTTLPDLQAAYNAWYDARKGGFNYIRKATPREFAYAFTVSVPGISRGRTKSMRYWRCSLS